MNRFNNNLTNDHSQQDVDDSAEDASAPNMACYAINVAARMLGARIAQDLAPLGLAPGQIPTLMALQHHVELNQAELARMTRVEQPTMAITLQRMERDGLVERHRDQNDKRARLISLTDKARELIPAMEAARLAVDAEAMSGLSADEQTTLDRLVHKVVGNLDNAD